MDPSKNWVFELYEGDTKLGSLSTLNDADGVLDFRDINLDPTKTYTLREPNVPAGWTPVWQVDFDEDGNLDATLVPYNPNANDTPPQDLGNRWVDFGANTQTPLTSGKLLFFEVNNMYPGGSPRTPGYWKNWNRCTGGGQAENADRQGGWEQGFWLLEDVLNPAIGGGIVWDDILPTGGKDIAPFGVTNCAMAVSILDQRDLVSGQKKSSDAAYTLAMHLLAAQLNFAAGAYLCQEVVDTAHEAEVLLDKLNFNGTGNYLRPNNPDYNYALQLGAFLDQYNNGNICGGPTVTITAPQNAATVSGLVPITANVGSPTPLLGVEFIVDGLSLGVDAQGSDGWSVTWDSTKVTDGSLTIIAQAVDQDGKIGRHSITVEVKNATAGTLHVGALTSSAKLSGTTWNATVTVTVHDAAHNAVPNASVYGSWNGKTPVAVATGANGQAVFTLKNNKTVTSVTLSVTDLVLTGYSYNSSANEVTTSVTINRP